MSLFWRWSLLASLFLFCSVLPAFAGISRNLSAADAFEMIRDRGDAVFILDVRTPGEYREVRLSGARLIPINQIPERFAEVPKEKAILVYCTIGSRSSKVVGFLARNGYSEVYNLYGGIYVWGKQGYPVLTGLP